MRVAAPFQRFKATAFDELAIVLEQRQKYYKGSLGRVEFEMGSAFAFIEKWQVSVASANKISGEKAIQLYQESCAASKRAVYCWLWLANALGVVKDIRLVIAELVLDDKAAWSVRRRRKKGLRTSD